MERRGHEILPGGLNIRTDYVNTDTVSVLLYALTEENRLACELALQTGWRISDILAIKSEQLAALSNRKRKLLRIVEQKTGKLSSKAIPVDLYNRLCAVAGTIYVFEGRDDYRKHRTRQAVYSDLKRAAKRFNIKINLAPHSLRKNYARYLYDSGKSLEEVQHDLNHTDISTTLIYVLADELKQRGNRNKKARD
jgi:site-specific recombinase XerD